MKKFKYFLFITLLLLPTIVLASEGNEIDLSAAIFIEAFVTIHMSLFVLKPLSYSLSKYNYNSLFWKMFIARIMFLLISDIFVTPMICMVDFFSVFIGAFLVVPIVAAIKHQNFINIMSSANSLFDKNNVFYYEVDEIYKKNRNKLSKEGLEKEKKKIIITPIIVLLLGISFFLHIHIFIQIILFILLIINLFDTNKNSLKSYIEEEFIKRKNENSKDIMIEISSNLVKNDLYKYKIVSALLVIIVLSIVFLNPRIYYKKVEGGYSVAYYIYGIKNITKAVIPDTYKGKSVVEIGDNAFRNTQLLKEVKMSDSIVKIGDSSFQNSLIEKIYFSKQLTYIGEKAFYNCENLKSAIIPNTVNYIGSEAFKKDSSLNEVELSKNLEVIQKGTFEECISLNSIEIPSNILYIREKAFAYDSDLATVSFASNSRLRAIEEYAFYECNSISYVEIPENIIVDTTAFPYNVEIDYK